jgi:hypothetical protein
MHLYPYHYEKMRREAYESLWQQWRKAYPSLTWSLVGELGNFFITFGSWLNKAAHAQIDELDRAGVRQRLSDVKQRRAIV